MKHNGNISFDEIISIAQTMRPRSIAKTLTGTVKEILGTAQSVGCSVDGKTPAEVMEGVTDGEYDIPDE